jgi:transcriptional regulator with XRE-family HTH domain
LQQVIISKGLLQVINQEAFDVAYKLQDEMKQAGVSRAKVLSEAGVSRATFWRWRQNVSSPRKASVTAIRDAIQRLSVEVAEEDV